MQLREFMDHVEEEEDGPITWPMALSAHPCLIVFETLNEFYLCLLLFVC